MREGPLKRYLPTRESITALHLTVARQSQDARAALPGLAALNDALAEIAANRQLISDHVTDSEAPTTILEREHAGGWFTCVVMLGGHRPFLKVEAPSDDRQLLKALSGLTQPASGEPRLECTAPIIAVRPGYWINLAP